MIQSVAEAMREMGLNARTENREVEELIEKMELPQSEIESITAAATKAAIYDAKRKLYFQNEAEIRRQKQAETERILRAPWDAQQLYEFILYRLNFYIENHVRKGSTYIVDEFNGPILRLLSLYFSNDKEFENQGDGFRLDKGIWLVGGTGVGKTLALSAFSKNKRQCYDVISCEKMAEYYTAIGDPALLRYSTVRYAVNSDPQVFYQKQIGICYEDVGTENDASNFGNKKNVFEKVILKAYDQRTQYPFHMRHATSNLTFDEIELRYGPRVRSRIREMFNIIQLEGPDRRA